MLRGRRLTQTWRGSGEVEHLGRTATIPPAARDGGGDDRAGDKFVRRLALHREDPHSIHAEAHGHGDPHGGHSDARGHTDPGDLDPDELDAHARMHMDQEGQRAPLGEQIKAIARPPVWLGLLMTLLGYGGVFTSYVYLEPLHPGG